MTILHKLYCSKCKKDNIPLIKQSLRKTKVSITQYYYCRDCNSEKMRKYYAKNADKVKECIYKSIIKHRAKQASRHALKYQIRIGKIKRPNTCSLCGKEGNIQGHHTDYKKPLEVVWLCSGCHADADKLK